MVTKISHFQSIGHNLIWPNFELVRDFMVVLVTCKSEEDQVIECSQHYTYFFSNAKGHIHNTVVGGGIWPNFDLIQAFIHILGTCKNEDDSIKMKELACLQHFPIIINGDFPDAQGQLTLQSIRSG